MRDLILHQLDQFLRPKFLQPMPQIAQALNDGIDAFQMMNPCIENGSRVFPCTSLKTDPARRPQEVAWLVATFFSGETIRVMCVFDFCTGNAKLLTQLSTNLTLTFQADRVNSSGYAHFLRRT